MATLEALTSRDKAAVSLPAPTPVVEGLLKMMAGQPLISDDGHFLEEVHRLSSLSILLHLPFSSGGQSFSEAGDWET